MFNAMLALHLLFAIFAVGPLVHAVTTASRGVRQGDSRATAHAARMSRIYSYGSVLTIIFGFALMSATSPFTHTQVAKFSETWIWLSLLLWAIAVAITLAVISPALDRATARIEDPRPLTGLAARIGASGGVVSLMFVAIVFLMVYQPGG